MKSKCAACKKKVGLLGFECAGCKVLHCASHRLAEDHSCSHIHVFKDTSLIEKTNPKVIPSKIVKI